MFTSEEKDRYSRQILLDAFNESGQEKLKQASVIVIGAGGLGCPSLKYLTAAGIGHLGLVDFDRVELSNLHRQLLYRTSDIGHKKAIAAAAHLLELNPFSRISEYDMRLDVSNVIETLKPFDIVIDGTDNLSTRYLINDACRLLNKPWIYGSVYHFEGQVSVFNAPLEDGTRGPDYRSLFPVPPPAASLVACNEGGIIGVLPGTIGMIQATECIKMICGLGELLTGKVLVYDALRMTTETFILDKISPSEDGCPENEEQFLATDYDSFSRRSSLDSFEITPGDLEILMKNEKILLVDIRESGEDTEMRDIESVKQPLSEISEAGKFPDSELPVVLVCQSGIRSKILLETLLKKKPEGKYYSLKNGVEGWNKFKLHKK